MFHRESSAEAGCYSHFHISGSEWEALLVQCLSAGTVGEYLIPLKCGIMLKTTDFSQDDCCYSTHIFIMLYIKVPLTDIS